MKRFALAALAALALLSGCQNAEQDVPALSSRHTVRFFAGTVDTRTAFDEAVNGVYQTRWTENDRELLLSLNYGEAESSLVVPSADGTTAWFEAAFDASATESPYTFYAVSPASAARAISPSRKAWSVQIAASQKPLATSVDEAAQLLVAKSDASETLPDKVNLHFTHLTAYGRISLRNLELGEATVRKVELVFSTPVVGEWYWGEDGTLTSNGASHTITLDTDASGDLWFACAPVDVSGATMSLVLFTDHGNLVKEITFPEGRKFSSGKVARFSVDMAGAEFGGGTDIFALVTDVSDIHAGDEVLIVNTSGTYALGAQSIGGTQYRARVPVVSESGLLTDAGNATVLTVEAGAQSGTWSFHTGNGYLSAAGSKNVLKESVTKDDYSSWTVSISNGVASVTAQAGASRLLRENTTQPRFSCYKQNSQNVYDVALYKKGGTLGPVVEDPLMAMSEYGSYIIGAKRTYVKGEDQLFRSYPDGRLEFALLNASTKEQLVVSGYDPTLAKGGKAQVSVHYRIGKKDILVKDYTLTVVKEDGPKVWLGDGSGQGFIIKK